MQWKLNQRGGVADLARQLDVLPMTLRNWKKALNNDPAWSRWAPRVSCPERNRNRNRNRRIIDDMADIIGRRIRDEFIAKHRPLTAPALMPIFQATWEVAHGYGPEEPWPGVDVAVRAIRGFLRRNRMGWRRRHDKRRPTVPVGIVEAFTQHTTELVRRIPPGDILNAEETCRILHANGFYTWAPRGC
jgi:transposase-like protein